MTKKKEGLSHEQVFEELVEKSTALWGPERTEALMRTPSRSLLGKSVLEATAQNIWKVANSLPHRDEQPCFFSKE